MFTEVGMDSSDPDAGSGYWTVNGGGDQSNYYNGEFMAGFMEIGGMDETFYPEGIGIQYRKIGEGTYAFRSSATGWTECGQLQKRLTIAFSRMESGTYGGSDVQVVEEFDARNTHQIQSIVWQQSDGQGGWTTIQGNTAGGLTLGSIYQSAAVDGSLRYAIDLTGDNATLPEAGFYRLYATFADKGTGEPVDMGSTEGGTAMGVHQQTVMNCLFKDNTYGYWIDGQDATVCGMSSSGVYFCRFVGNDYGIWFVTLGKITQAPSFGPFAMTSLRTMTLTSAMRAVTTSSSIRSAISARMPRGSF